VGAPVGLSVGLDDVAAEGERVDDGGAEPVVGEGLLQAVNESSEAIAKELVFSRSVRTWKSSSAGRRSTQQASISTPSPSDRSDNPSGASSRQAD
jgi:hypothetical protein